MIARAFVADKTTPRRTLASLLKSRELYNNTNTKHHDNDDDDTHNDC